MPGLQARWVAAGLLGLTLGAASRTTVSPQTQLRHPHRVLGEAICLLLVLVSRLTHSWFGLQRRRGPGMDADMAEVMSEVALVLGPSARFASSACRGEPLARDRPVRPARLQLTCAARAGARRAAATTRAAVLHRRRGGKRC